MSDAKPTCPNHLILDKLPKMVKDLTDGSNRHALDASLLFFKKGAGTWAPPAGISSSGLPVDYCLYYLWQGDGSLAVYAHLFVIDPGSDERPPPSVGCMWLGFISHNMWKS